MGLMLSVLVGCVGVLEAIDCYNKLLSGMIPIGQRDLQYLTKHYEEMFKKSLPSSESRANGWLKGGQGYLELSGGGADGPLKAEIKYYGQDSTPILFSTKISSFGQESYENDLPNGKSPKRDVSPRNELNVEESYFGSDRNRSSESPGLWEDEQTSEKQEITEPKEKITWRYRPLTPTSNESSLPEIHFDSYERKSLDNDATQSDALYRSLDGIKLRPIQRDDSKRRSFKKRHSSSSGSSRESKASREEEVNMFTSLEEAEFENSVIKPEYSSSPNLTANYHSKSRSKSPANGIDTAVQNGMRNGRSPSAERPHLRNIPKSDSFEEEEATSLKDDVDRKESVEVVNADDGDEGVNFWDQ